MSGTTCWWWHWCKGGLTVIFLSAMESLILGKSRQSSHRRELQGFPSQGSRKGWCVLKKWTYLVVIFHKVFRCIPSLLLWACSWEWWFCGRYDLTAILLCVLDHLTWASNSASKLLDPGHGQLPHYSIHNLCSNLLAALAVVASPLDAVYRCHAVFSLLDLLI